jgi:capsid protein
VKVRKDIDLREDVLRHIAHCHISYSDDGKLCSHLAIQVYKNKSRARGLKHEAQDVEILARRVYKAIPGLVTESLKDWPLEKLEVKLVPNGENEYEYEVGVFQKQEE